MKEAVRQTRSYLLKLFNDHGFNPRTDLGQNFLIDLNIVEYIAKHGELEPRDVVLEVGTGTGGLTTFLAQKAGAVISLEIDTKMFKLAEAAVIGLENVTLINQDVLKNKNHFAPNVLELIEDKLKEIPDSRLKLISNLPYSIATPVVSNLVATDLPWELMIVTIQLELGQRMTSKPRGSHYGSLSAWLQAQCNVELIKRLPPNVFWPRPKVESAIMRLTPNHDRQKRIHGRAFYQDFLRRLFHQRRKLLRSVLVGMYRKQLGKVEIDAILAKMGFSPTVRAEELRFDVLATLSNRVYDEIARLDDSKDSHSNNQTTIPEQSDRS